MGIHEPETIGICGHFSIPFVALVGRVEPRAPALVLHDVGQANSVLELLKARIWRA
jgi:hypothetical protein